jgi:(2Fe-2S) ferredoxin
MVAYYSRHVFFCCNQREQGRACCNNHGAHRLRVYAKARLNAIEANKTGKVRVNQAGCMDRCDEGPVVVVYPEGVWYTYVDEQDIDEIIEQHVLNGQIVERLRI